MQDHQAKTVSNGHKRIVIMLLFAVVGMFAFGFALVPLYDVLCDTLGINGKTNQQAVLYDDVVDTSRTVMVEFIATHPSNLRWDFYPLIKKVRLHPGEMKQLAFFAENQMGKTVTVQAIPSVTPGLAAKYLKKTECFCFNQQTLASGESMEMPLLFHLDTALPKNINTITLAYTLYDVTDRQVRSNKTNNRIA